jgi:uncharacterized protein (UPF0332 family)
MKQVMPKWKDLARDNRLAAYELNRAGHWRSCVSRAYYAIFSATTGILILQGIRMSKDHSNPSHVKLPALVRVHLARLQHHRRWRLAALIRTLYNMRLAADYQPQVAVEAPEARQAIGLMEQAFRYIEDRK